MQTKHVSFCGPRKVTICTYCRLCVCVCVCVCIADAATSLASYLSSIVAEGRLAKQQVGGVLG